VKGSEAVPRLVAHRLEYQIWTMRKH